MDIETNLVAYGRISGFEATNDYLHSNMKGTGGMVRFSLRPATAARSGAVFASFAMQAEPQGAPADLPIFDWENRVAVKFERDDIAQLLAVLDGTALAANNGHGLFHRTPRANTVIKFSRITEPRTGYMMSVSRKSETGELRNAWFMFDDIEARSLRASLEYALPIVCFGLPRMRSGEIGEE